MANRDRGAQSDLATNFGEPGRLESDGTQEAADAWFSVLADDEEHSEGNAVDESPDDDGQEADESEDDTDEVEDEDEGEDDPEEDEEDDEEESEEDDEPTSQALDPKTKVKVKVDGEEVEVALEELQAGYSRTQDYTRKTQQVADERRQLEAQRDEVLQQRQQWSQLLDQLKPRIEAQLSGRTEAEWAQLKAQDELTYYEERDKERAVQDRVQAIRQEQEAVQRDMQAKQQEQLNRWAQHEKDQLFSKIPDWATDEAVAKREMQQMKEYGTEIGFTQEELSNLIDHRALLILRDAAKFRALSKAKEKGKSKVQKKTRTLKPGTPSNEKPSRAKARKAQQRLAKTHTVGAAVDVFEQLLNDE
jgi:hypothetical protein